MSAVKLIKVTSERATPDGKRIIRGIASTAHRDRHGETVSPKGISWKLPVPLLASHDHRAPIGRVIDLVATDTELRFTAVISQATEQARQVWELIGDGTLSGVSIGFIGLEHEAQPKGLHWKAAELLEISVVSVPSNRESRILTSAGKEATPPATKAPSVGAVRLIKRYS